MRKRILFGEHTVWGTRLVWRAKRAGFDVSMAQLCDADLETYDAVIPLTLAQRDHLEARRRSGVRIKALFPSAEVTALCNDKGAFNARLFELGFADFIPPLVSGQVLADYPLILKPRFDYWGRNSRIISAPDQLPQTIDLQTHFLQRFVPGPQDWTSHFLLREGQIVYSASVRCEMGETPAVRGQHATPSSFHDIPRSPCEDIFAAILRAIGFTDGTCCFDYRLVDNKPMIFELNPRFGGSLIRTLGPYLEAYLHAAANHEGVCV